MEDEVKSITEAVENELDEFTRSVTPTTTGAVGSEPSVITESVDVVELMSAGAAALARAAWCLAARWQFFSFSAGQR